MRNSLPLIYAAAAISLTGCAAFNALETTENACVKVWDKLDARASVLQENSTSVQRNASTAEMNSLSTIVNGDFALEDCIKAALANNMELRKKEFSNGELQGQWLQARAALLPSVDLSAGADTQRPEEAHKSSESYSASVTISQALWRGGALRAGMDMASYQLAGGLLDYMWQRATVQYDVSLKFERVLLERKLIEVYEGALRTAERMLSTAKSKNAHGTASEYQVLRGQVEVATATAALLRERNNLSEAIIDLYTAMGVSQESDVNFAGELTFERRETDFEQMAQAALKSRPDLAAANARVMIAEENMRIVEARYKPDADLYAKGEYADRGDGWEDKWTIGVSARYPLFDGGERHGRMVSAEYSLKKAVAERQQKEQDVLADVAMARLEMEYAEKLYASQEKNTELSQRALSIVESGFKYGKNTQVEVLDAQAALTEAMGAFYQAIYTYNTAKLRLSYVMGMLFEEKQDK